MRFSDLSAGDLQMRFALAKRGGALDQRFVRGVEIELYEVFERDAADEDRDVFKLLREHVLQGVHTAVFRVGKRLRLRVARSDADEYEMRVCQSGKQFPVLEIHLENRFLLIPFPFVFQPISHESERP